MFIMFMDVQRVVQLRAVFIKIDEIQTVQEQFTGIVFIRARWREPALDNSATRVCVSLSSSW